MDRERRQNTDLTVISWLQCSTDAVKVSFIKVFNKNAHTNVSIFSVIEIVSTFPLELIVFSVCLLYDRTRVVKT